MKTILNSAIFFALMFLLGCSKGDSSGGNTVTTPVSPSELSATVISSTQVNLSWKDNSSNESGFTIERKTVTGIFSPVVTTTSANTTTYSDIALQPGTSYTYRIIAHNLAGNSAAYTNEITVTTTPGANVISDVDGNVYPTIVQCTQTWIAKNLSVTHYRNGDVIPQISDLTLWSTSHTGAWCYVHNDPTTEAVYGRLYNWAAVNDPRGIAPSGWHVPSLYEYNKIFKCIDPAADTTVIGTISHIAGGAMKETGYTHWLSPNFGATNSSNFSAMPAGDRADFPANYEYFGQLASFWTTTQQNSAYSYVFYLSYAGNVAITNVAPIDMGLSIRCVKD